MVELTQEQRLTLAQEENPTVIDPETRAEYVLVRKELYERLRTLVYNDGEWTDDELRHQLAKSSEANGWNEPSMDAYDRYDENRPCP